MGAEGALVECFGRLQDPRMVNKCRHALLDIIIIAVCATIADADNWEEIALFGESKAAWLGQFLALPNGIPSADTFQRVFEHLDGDAFQGCFMAWVSEVFVLTQGQVVAVDGKSGRGTYDAQGQNGLHLVSAWATANRLTLGQLKVENKANEIVAIPALLELLALKGCIVTIDAMGCQKKIVQAIREQDADYVVTVKGNQPKLKRSIQEAFAAQDALGWQAQPDAVQCTDETAHARHEVRRCCVLSDTHLQDLGWAHCQSLVRIERTTTRAGKTSQQTHYYISSLSANASTLLHIIRQHWGIENRCHWVLDVVFNEDASRARKGALNLAILRKMALNFLHQEPSKGSLKAKRYRASLSEDFLASILQSSFNLMP